MTMHFICQKAILSGALANAARAVSAKAADEVLKGLLLECKGDDLTITGNDLELGITCSVPAEVKAEGGIILEARMICEMVRRAPGSDIELFVEESGQTTIKSGKSVYNITSLPAENYPTLPSVSELRSLTLPQHTLKRLLSKTLFSVSDDESKHIHTGVLFDIETETLTLVALDGHRLATSRIQLESQEAFSNILPAASLRELERMLSDDDATLTLAFGERHALIELPNLTLITRIMHGEFFKYKTGIPQDGTFTATLNIKEFAAALERASLLITDKLKSPVRLAFSENSLSVLCQTAIGRATEEIACECSEILEIGFNHRYLLDALRKTDGEQALFETNGSVAPCVLSSVSDEDSRFMVLPVRLSSHP